MRFNSLMILAGAALVGACGGGDAKTDTAAGVDTTTTPPSSTVTPPAGATTGATTGATPAGGVAAPATGKTHTVRMLADGAAMKFEPANITVKAGDQIKWVMISGVPHNVAFQDVPADVKGQLDANMPEKIAPLTGKMMMTPNEEYTVSFANVKPGTYNYVCQPHVAMGMKGVVTVQ